MEILNQIMLPPSVGLLEMLPALIVFMLVFHLPYIGIVITSSVLSLITGHTNDSPDVSHRFSDLLAGQRSALWVFGVFPLPVITLLLSKFHYGTFLPVSSYMMKILPLAFAGLFLLHMFSRSRNKALGGLGVLLATGAYFLYASLFTLFLFPEKWEIVTGALPLFFSVKVLLHFILLLTVSGLVTGGFLLVKYFKFHETRLDESAPEYSAMRAWGLFLIISTAAALPLLFAADLFASPVYAVTTLAYKATLYGIVALLIAILMGILMVSGNHLKFVSCVFGLSLICVLSWVLKDYALLANSNMEHTIALNMTAEKAYNEFKSERESFYVKFQELDPEMGKNIYESKCSACHNFDTVVLGPAYKDVLPKYAGDLDALKTFIKNPVKIDPNFPVMPNQGLSTMEVEAITKYLMDELAAKEAN